MCAVGGEIPYNTAIEGCASNVNKLGNKSPNNKYCDIYSETARQGEANIITCCAAIAVKSGNSALSSAAALSSSSCSAVFSVC